MADTGEWIEADPNVTLTATTINRHVDAVLSDAFDVLRVMVVDDNTVVVEVRNIDTKALFHNTWTFIEEEEKTNGE